MNNRQIAENYAYGHTSGKGSNIFIEGNTIYSYGYHFKIAVRLNSNTYLFNWCDYSSTTQRHKSHVSGALNGATLIYIEDCDINKAQPQHDRNSREIENLKVKIKRARKERIKLNYASDIANLESQNELLKGLIAQQKSEEAV